MAKKKTEPEQDMTLEGLQAAARAQFAASEPEQAANLERAILAQVARSLDNQDGFESFYEVIHGKPMPPHARAWAKYLYKARDDIATTAAAIAEGKDPDPNSKLGVVIEAFRGSTKTTTVTVTFTAFQIGQHPERTNLLIQVADDIAQDNTSSIASIIQDNAGWKLVFPNVVPDEAKGWGAGGYNVKRSDMPYENWKQMVSQEKDPTLLGLGYKSRELIGKHPSGLLVVDDIHDENNTSSERELANVQKILTGTIFPTKVPGKTLTVFIGTPWVENDTLHYTASTGLYYHKKTPARITKADGSYAYAWPTRFGAAQLEATGKEVGGTEFARMYLLDLSAQKNKVFKYQLYPASNINYKWPYYGGVDYAGTMDEFRNRSGVNDYFALAYVAKLPDGGAVVVDGVLAHCTQGEAEGYVKRAQEIFITWQNCAVEGDGKGEEFIQVIRRNPLLKIFPIKTKGVSKAVRLEKGMGPWLENGALRISDAETPFLNELRRELDTYPLCAHDDAMDAVNIAMYLMPDVFITPRFKEYGLPEGTRKHKTTNPFIYLGRTR